MPQPTTKGWLRRESIDLGLDVIASVRRPGQSLSCDDIAAVCGCSPQAIRYIQQRALAKMRQRALELHGGVGSEVAR